MKGRPLKRVSFLLATAAAFVATAAHNSVRAAAQAGTSIAQQLVTAFDKIVHGPYPGARCNHAKGFVCAAAFTPTPDASSLSTAAHFKHTVKALVRFSDFGGLPSVPDNSPHASPHGMAVKFYLPDGSQTDIVGHSSPYFPSPTAEQFKGFLEAVAGGEPAVKAYIATRPKAAQFVQSIKPGPVSVATISYHFINAFRFVDAGGKSQAVRYTMRAHEPEAYLDPAAANAKGPNYLRPELASRLKRGPVMFDYVVQIAEPGDVTNDPTHYWPESRRTVNLGTLSISSIVPNSDEVQHKTLWDPARLTTGITLSDDQLPAIRSQAYAISFARRLAS